MCSTQGTSKPHASYLNKDLFMLMASAAAVYGIGTKRPRRRDKVSTASGQFIRTSKRGPAGTDARKKAVFIQNIKRGLYRASNRLRLCPHKPRSFLGYVFIASPHCCQLP